MQRRRLFLQSVNDNGSELQPSIMPSNQHLHYAQHIYEYKQSICGLLNKYNGKSIISDLLRWAEDVNIEDMLSTPIVSTHNEQATGF